MQGDPEISVTQDINFKEAWSRPGESPRPKKNQATNGEWTEETSEKDVNRRIRTPQVSTTASLLQEIITRAELFQQDVPKIVQKTDNNELTLKLILEERQAWKEVTRQGDKETVGSGVNN